MSAAMQDVKGKTAFITGGVSGIGMGIAQAFAAAGIRVVATYRSPDHRDEAAAWFARHPDMEVHLVPLDVLHPERFEPAADAAEALVGPIDILVNNAGVNLFGPCEDASLADWEWVMGVNFYGVLHGIRTFVPRMKARGGGGHIVNVGSMGSFFSGPQAGLYSASKFAVRALTESLRDTLAPHGIVVSLMAPGLVQSRIHEAPRRREAAQGDIGLESDEALLDMIGEVHALGMDAREAGERTLVGMRRGDLYIFTHPDHRPDFIELHEQMLAALPDEPVPPQRLAIEEARRQASRDARSGKLDIGELMAKR